MDLEKQEFFAKYRDFAPNQRGYGFWLWKPYLINNKLQDLSNNDVLCYVDSGDIIRQDPIPLLQERLS